MTRHLITSALPYINGIKHLGNLIGSLLPADVYARFLRQQGEDVLYICATDEHGAPAELAARAEGMGVAEYCAKQHGIQADIYRRFALDFDYFGRSSSPANHGLTREFFDQLDRAGFIAERELELVYSVDDGRFLPDRYVVGTCPRCGYEAARGDQCENCTSLLDPTDLVEPRSAISGSTSLEVRKSRHYFLKLAALEDEVRTWVEGHADWPLLSRQVARKWLGEGLRDRCITRDLEWGVKVERPGFEDKVFYVWFDAPIGYISATRDWAEAGGTPEAWREYWTAGGDVEYTQFMGKDNLPFHTVMFPAMQLGTRTDWKMADVVKGFHWMNYYGGKFSTTLGRGVFTDQALEIYPADVWRYFLMSNAPETADYTFSWEQFAALVNKDLVGIIGNFVNRVLKLTKSKFGMEIPKGGEPGTVEVELIAQCKAEVEAYTTAMRALEFRAAMRALRTLWTHCNVYIDERAPWTLVKTDRDGAAMVMRTCFNLIRLASEVSLPVIPDTAGRFLGALMLAEEDERIPLGELAELSSLEGGRPFELIPPAFARVLPEEVERHKERFGS